MFTLLLTVHLLVCGYMTITLKEKSQKGHKTFISKYFTHV